MKRTWRQVKGKGLVEVTASPSLPSDLRVDSPFVSPVDGTVIRHKRDLHDHNQRNNVMQVLPGVPQDIMSIQKDNLDKINGKSGKRERLEAVKRAVELQGE